ncbi:shikimate kinase [Christiangramia aquimixticola]|uniref:shikimate kinase n=1 Tax=Christiangramia aquimixticola TaxID=1697558 RepID=UPI003AA7DA94
MKIFLLGYMGSGKSFIGNQLAESLGCEFLDLDNEIEKQCDMKISEIFTRKGEVFFRKAERKMLEKLLKFDSPAVVALGGGTPCYGNNMEMIKAEEDVASVYLKLNIENLKGRLLKEKDSRPMISHLETEELLEEFIRKHLFERGFYYNQSDYIVDCNSKTSQEIIAEIKERLK